MSTTARRGLVAAALTLVLLVLPASTAIAQTELLSGVYDMADVDPDRVIPASFPSYQDASDCIWEDCEHLEDVFFVDVDISEEMADYDGYAQFYVVNGFVSQTTWWFVCSYDAEGTPVDCFTDDEPSWGLMDELSADARELRLFPIRSAATEYHLEIYVE